MSKTDFQNGFALGIASGGVVEVEDTTTIDNLENLVDESGVLESTEGSVIEKVEQLIDKVEPLKYIGHPLPQDDYVYYRYPPCNEDRYIRLGTSTIEYGILSADGYTKVGTMNGVQEGSYYEFTIPAHKEDFIIKFSVMPKYGRSNADCTEFIYGEKAQGLGARANAYTFAPTTINGLKKITINKSLGPAQVYGMFRTLPCETIQFKSVNGINASQNIFIDCVFLKEVQFEEMILANPSNAFQNCASLKTIDCSKIVPTGSIVNMFYGCSSLETLDVSSWATQSSTFTNVSGLFRYCGDLKTINLSGWDLSHLTSVNDWFDGNSLLENVILPNDDTTTTTLFSANFKINSCLNLTRKSIAAIFTALPQLAEGIARTITLHANQKILQTQVDRANEKGWTIAGGTVVSEEEYNG